MIKKLYKCVILCLILLIGCAGSKKVSNAENVETPQYELNESFDPATLNDYDFEIKEQQKSDVGALDIDEFLKSGEQADSLQKNELVPGYRVQLIATRSVAEARAIKREALLTFEGLVYLTFDDPYYKVRLGDETSRFDANDLQEVAITKGYLGAWVVRTIVNKNPKFVLDQEE
jgi:hypothetical protein